MKSERRYIVWVYRSDNITRPERTEFHHYEEAEKEYLSKSLGKGIVRLVVSLDGMPIRQRDDPDFDWDAEMKRIAGNVI